MPADFMIQYSCILGETRMNMILWVIYIFAIEGFWVDLWIRVRLIQRLVSLHQSRTAKLTFIHTLQYLISYPNSNLSPQILKIETPPVLLQFVHVNFKGHENVKRVTRALWSTFFGPYFFICFFWQIDKLKSDYWEKLRCHTWHTHTDIGK